MIRKLGTAVALVALLSGAAVAQTAKDAKAVVADTTKAMGYDKLNTIQYSGSAFEGTAFNQLQSVAAGWPKFTEKNYVRFIDFAAGTSTRTALQSRPVDPKTGILPGGGGLDPGAEAPIPPQNQNIAANANWTAKLEITLSAPGFLRMAAAASNATVTTESSGGKKYTVVSFPVDAKAPTGVAYKLSGFIDDKNMLAKVQTWLEEPSMIGDYLVEESFLDYKDYGGVKFPSTITQTRAGLSWNVINITDVKPNAIAPPPLPAAAPGGGGGGRGGGAAGAPAAGGAPGGGAPGGGAGGGGGRGGAGAAGGAPGGGAPGGGAPGGGAGGGRGAAAAGAPAAGGGQAAAGGRGAAAATTSRKLGEGIYMITSGYRSIAVEFKDHVVLIEANAAGFDGTVAETKKLFPNKPITFLISTHNHQDHSGSIRTAVAEGMTIVAQQMNKALYPVWFNNPRELSGPDKLAQMQADAKAKGDKAALKKLTPKFQWVGEKLVMKDATQSIELYAIHGSVHGEDMLVAYMPKIKTIFESDAYNVGAPGAVTTGVGQLAFQKLLASELDRLKVDYNFIVPGHAPTGGDRDVTKADLMKAIGTAAGN